MRRGERAPSDIPLENKQNKTGFSGQVFSRFIKFTNFFLFPLLNVLLISWREKKNPKILHQTSANESALSSCFKSLVGSASNAISRLSVVKWRCLLSSCHRMVWQEGGMAFCGAGEDETSRCPIRRNTPGFCYIVPALSRFMIYLSENSSCWVEPITILSNNVFLLLHSSAKQVKTELPEWIYPTLLCREYTLKIGWRGGNLLTSGLKAQESVFNVRGCPCLCVDARGSMKGSSRGHFRHLLLPRTTHLSICRHGCPSVHAHTDRHPPQN